ncbi:MAG: tetratricopeptide repeat protein [Acidobacteriaceae bacterium]
MPVTNGAGLSIVVPSTWKRLDSWKEIASYFNKQVRTVQRWEASEGLPVHRHHHSKLGSIYAFESELAAWWEKRRNREEFKQEPAKRSLHLLTTAFAAERIRILIAPMKILSDDPGSVSFANAFVEELTTEIGRMQSSGLSVISSRYAFSNPAPYGELPPAARPAYLIEGSVRSRGDGMRLCIHILSVADLEIMWSESYAFHFADNADLENQAARKVAADLPIDLMQKLGSGQEQARSLHVDADPLCRLGMELSAHQTRFTLKKSVRSFHQAIERSKSYSPCYSGLSYAYSLMNYLEVADAQRIMPKAREMAKLAIFYDPRSAKAHTALATVQGFYDWDWRAATAEYETALVLDPDCEESSAWYAGMLAAQRRYGEAIGLLQKALAGRPESGLLAATLSETYWSQGQYEEAERQGLKLVEEQPDFVVGHAMLGIVHLAMGKMDCAQQDFQKAIHLSKDDIYLQALLAQSLIGAGEVEAAEKILAAISHPRAGHELPQYDIAAAYSMMGRKEQSVHWLTRAFESRSMRMVYLQHDPRFQTLRSSAEVKAMCSRISARM